MGRYTNQLRETKWEKYKSTTRLEMSRRTNQPRDTKWAKIQIN